ncbi:MAG TPA: thioesterase family protein [Candidatus Baltobacteraceae bacterium]|nr:thioesterase family protein [Candidatus Baltobacteraceae bacterium]
MKDTLRVGDVFTWSYKIPREKTVPFLYPESDIYRAMPEVFATGYMVGLIEWCCIEALRPHLEKGEGSLGTLINVTHTSPTPVGMNVTVTAICDEIREGDNVLWTVTVRDEEDLIGEGRHGRHVVQWDRFNRRLEKKIEKLQQSTRGHRMM